MHKVHLINIYYFIRYLGLKWLLFRILYGLKIKAGFLKLKMPSIKWENLDFKDFLYENVTSESRDYLQYRKKNAPKFFFSSEKISNFIDNFNLWDSQENATLRIANDLVEGKLEYFRNETKHIGYPPDWFYNPYLKNRVPSSSHWSEFPDFSCGDIKIIWEPSRFGFVYQLVRAYWRTSNEKYAECFWCLIEDWFDKNPPQIGPNWKCGQEISFRLMAWIFGLYGFLDSSTTTSERVLLLSKMIAVSGERIEANFSYAYNQKNNHGISESVGLWTIGLLFPEFKNAKNWKKKGKAYLEKLAEQLIYCDGTFVQHSVNYHRLMLHDYIWAIRLGQLNGESFSDKLKKKIQNAAEFLYKIQNAENGYVPNYGKNDGALILPLDNCNYRDYRPVIQSAYYLTTGFRCYESGPADESLFWLFGSEALKTAVKPPKQTNLIAEDGGYYTIRTDKSFIFTRCASYKHRPSDSDMLHVDLWWKGINIALDPGTYSYNAPNFWKDGLAGTAFHNSVTVDNLDQMDKISSFLWLPWLKSKLLTSKISKSKLVEYWEGHHKGYCRIKSPVIHSRGIIRIGDEHWIILDRLSSKKKHGYRLHWLLQNYPYEWKDDEGQIVLKTRKGSFVVQIGVIEAKPNYSLIKGDPESPRGWKSSYYYAKEPAISVDASVVGENRLFWTVLGPEGFVIDSGQGTLNLKTETWKSSITINDHRQKLIVSDISLSSGKYEKLNIS